MKFQSMEIITLRLRDIRKSENSQAFQANQILSISKPTPENLEVYDVKDGSLSIFHEFLNLTTNSLKLLCKLLSVGWHVPIQKQTACGPLKCLFISHSFKSFSESSDPVDHFFGRLPDLARDRGFLPDVHFINQVSSSLQAREIVTEKNLRSSKTIGIYSLNVHYFLLYLKNLLLALKLFLRGLRATIDERGLILRIAVAQVSLQTFKNQIIANHILKEIKSGEVGEIWLTFEGHAYERAVLQAIKQAGALININLYQHAPIIPGQIGVMELLEDFGSMVDVHTCGNVTYKYLLSAFPELNARVHVAGSMKNSAKQKIYTGGNRKNKGFLLFLPEGTSQSLLSMVDLALDVSVLNDSANILFRLHPNSPNKAAQMAQQLLKKANVRLSYGTLIDDFCSSYACVYRSSAAVIESLAYELLPIYFSPSGDRSLDCLALSSLKYPLIDSALSLAELLSGDELKFVSEYFSSKNEFEEFSEQYFTPLVIDT